VIFILVSVAFDGYVWFKPEFFSSYVPGHLLWQVAKGRILLHLLMPGTYCCLIPFFEQHMPRGGWLQKT
jgi:hypothetical protein